jgi:hypothetical protein
MTMDAFVAWLTARLVDILQLVTVIIATVVGLATYRQAKRTERIKVLLDLHRRFVDSELFSEVRLLIEREDRDFLALLQFAASNASMSSAGLPLVKGKQADVILESFDEYLAFFELLGYMWRRAGFKLEDIEGLFGYYLLRLRQEQIWSYIRVPKFGLHAVMDLINETAEAQNRVRRARFRRR